MRGLVQRIAGDVDGFVDDEAVLILIAVHHTRLAHMIATLRTRRSRGGSGAMAHWRSLRDRTLGCSARCDKTPERPPTASPAKLRATLLPSQRRAPSATTPCSQSSYTTWPCQGCGRTEANGRWSWRLCRGVLGSSRDRAVLGSVCSGMTAMLEGHELGTQQSGHATTSSLVPVLLGVGGVPRVIHQPSLIGDGGARFTG